MAIADLLSFYALTKMWFLPSEYRPFRSKPVPIHTYDIPCSCACTYRIREERSVVAEYLKMHYDAPAEQPSTPCVNGHYYVGEPAVASLEEARWRNLSDEERMEESNRVVCSRTKAYPASFLWYQLSYWFEQESNEASTVFAMRCGVRRRLRLERRGCLMLPNLDDCYRNATVRLRGWNDA